MKLEELNSLNILDANAEFSKCCGAQNWVGQMVSDRPYANIDALIEHAHEVWTKCDEKDGLDAFSHHPKIGDVKNLEKKFANTSEWSGSEQKSVEAASRITLEKLAAMNTKYEDKFGFIFIVCATNKSANEMLKSLETRICNSHDEEIKIAMEEQGKITQLRLRKLLQ